MKEIAKYDEMEETERENTKGERKQRDEIKIGYIFKPYTISSI